MVRSLRSMMTLVGALAAALLMSSSAAAWTGNVTTEPMTVEAGVPFDCTVTIANNGNSTLHVEKIVYSADWPYPLPEEMGKPMEDLTLFEGDQAIEPGKAYQVKGRVGAGVSINGVIIRTTVTAHAEGEASSEQIITGYIHTIESTNGSTSERDNTMLFEVIVGGIVVILSIVVAWIRIKNRIPPLAPIWSGKYSGVEVKDCPFCEREIPEDSRLCPYCGKKQ